MNVKRVAFPAFVLLSVGTVLVGGRCYWLDAQAAPMAAEDRADVRGAEGDKVPPEIKKGARLWLSAHKIPFNEKTYADGFVVEEIKGNWVRMKGESFEGAPWKEKTVSAWINFRNVDWYKVKE